MKSQIRFASVSASPFCLIPQLTFRKYFSAKTILPSSFLYQSVLNALIAEVVQKLLLFFQSLNALNEEMLLNIFTDSSREKFTFSSFSALFFFFRCFFMLLVALLKLSILCLCKCVNFFCSREMTLVSFSKLVSNGSKKST